MEPGRELDALVAEKIFGLVRLRKPDADEYCHFNGEPLLGDPSTAKVSILKHYSTDIAAAWEVVEKLKDSKEAYGFELIQDQGELMEWQASFNHRFHGEGETVPEAICLAALKAVGASL